MLDPIITAFLCYIYGSIPFAYIYTYLAKGEKITELGSKNVGVANTFSVAGMLPGVFTVLGEISKGIVPILVSLVFYDYALELSILFVTCSFVGTNFSIFLKFKGGMGFTIFLWSTLILSPLSVVA